MSSGFSFADYRTILTAPGARGPVVASVIARLPFAMLSMSLLLYVHRESGSFEVAGLVSAASLTGFGLGAIVQGRLIDRLGPTLPLSVTAIVFGALVTAELIAIETVGSARVIVPLAFLAGLFQPSVGPASRALWTRLATTERQRSAGYSYEAISLESFFILGPGLAGLLTSLPWGGTGVVAGAASTVVGALWFACSRAVRSWVPEPATGHRSFFGPLVSPGIWTVIVAALAFGYVLGSAELAVPAMTDRFAAATIGGVLLSLWAVSSVAFGIVYSTRPWPRPMGSRMALLLAAFSALICVLAVAWSLAVLVVLMLLAGTLITPQAAGHSTALETAAPAGTEAEGFGWVMTSMTIGGAVGQAITGTAVESFGPATAFLVAGGVGLVLAGIVWLRRPTLAVSVPVTPSAAPIPS